MRSSATRSNSLDTLVAALKSGTLDEAAAQQLYQLGPHAVILALLAAASSQTPLCRAVTSSSNVFERVVALRMPRV